MVESLEPALLTTFLAVLEAGRISSAAKGLHLSQPAVTAQIRKLEDTVGASLFVRSVRGVSPTEAGLRLSEVARSVRRLLDDAGGNGSEAAPLRGPLVLAASTTIAAHLVPLLLRAFRDAHPTTAIRVHVANTEQVVDEVRTGRIPIGLVEGHARVAGVRLEPFVDDEIVPVVGRAAPFTLHAVKDLDHVPILWRERGSGTRAVVERALKRAGVLRRKARELDLELGSTEAILGGARAGLGLAFVSRWSVRAHLAAGHVRIVPGFGLLLKRTFHWALPTGALGGMAARFHALAERTTLA